ncbi:MAG: hypothetical protein AB8I08_26130 [Sandaracinaceae bacterium]
MSVFRICSALFFSLAMMTTVAGCNDAREAGNRLECMGGSCSSSCDNEGTGVSCEVFCREGTSCDASCNAGQDCRFFCDPGATCTFDCTSGSCSLMGTGATSCSCSGTCPGTCSDTGATTMFPGDAGPDESGGDCTDFCGEPTDPGYAACVTACS